jgi:hypothetical protein
MKRFMIEVDHSAEKRACTEAIKQILEMGSHFVTHADWGCLDDVHTGWIVVEAESHEEARMVLPPSDREAARVIRLTRFRVDDLGELRAHHEG